jgi:hypothetical protein
MNMSGILPDDIGTPASAARQEAFRLELQAEAAKAQASADKLAEQLGVIDDMDEALSAVPGIAEFIERERAAAREISAEQKARYRHDFGAWRRWADENGVTPLPAHPVALANFIVASGEWGPRQAGRVLAAIDAVHKLAELETPTADVRVRAAVQFLRDLQKRFPEPKRGAKPDATPEEKS